MTTTVLAPAKINLDLRVLGRRSDGFHEIVTVLQSLELHDTLSFRRRPGPMTVRIRSGEVSSDRANLVWTAACALWSASGHPDVPRDIAVTIQKRIPTAAGLGGGSSDAATALRGLSDMWGIPADIRWLRKVASRIGSDVPYFLDGGVALGRGRGERIRRLADIGPWWVVLARPSFGVSSADGYRWLDTVTGRDQRLVRRPGTLPRGWRGRLDLLGNELEPVVVGRHPEIGTMVDRLSATGAVLAAMTGSGSTVFGLFRRRAMAHAARRAIRRPGWRTILTRTIGRLEFARMTGVAGRQG